MAKISKIAKDSLKITYINIFDYDYPMSFSLAARKGIGEIAKADKSKDVTEGFDSLMEMLYQLIFHGTEYLNRHPYFQKPDKNYKKDGNGKLLCIKREELEEIPMYKEVMEYIEECIAECSQAGQHKKISAKAKTDAKKN